MIGSEIIKIYRIDGEINRTIILTSAGYFEIKGNGFFQREDKNPDGYKEFDKYILKGNFITEAKSDLEYTILKLSNGDFLIHHIDTPFLSIVTNAEINKDIQFLMWYENDMQLLTNEKHYAVF